MKKLTTLFFGFLFTFTMAQAPANYYDGTAGLTGAALKTKLSQIISNGHKDKGYEALYTGYETTDRDYFFENDGTVLDMYSENPNGPDPYNFTPGQKQCGNYSNEGDCYNREHIVPQSLFSQNSPMRSDINFIRPTDGKVNGMRSNYPFGMVSKPTFTSKNGSKVGNNTTSGYSGTVFEPIDTFKGDIARMVFYFVTRYESRMADFNTGNMLAKNTYPSLQDWELKVLLNWAAQDPVSPEEIARNNASYIFQGNRNPYIDHPEWVQAVWGTSSSDTQAPTAPTNLTVNSTTTSTVSLSWAAATDNIGIASYEIYVDGVLKTTVSGSVTAATVTGLAANTTYSFYIIAKDAAGNASPASNTVQGTTLPANAGTTCVNEDFENIPANNNSYSTRTWTNKGINWTATDARTDEKLNNRAIVIRNGSLTGSAVPNGIGSLTVTTQLKFSGTEGTFDLFVNGVKKGAVPYASGKLTTTISDINIEGNVTVKLVNTSTSNRVALDDLSWTCYSSTLGLGETNVGAKKLTVSPNPVKNGTIQISGLEESNVRAEIYNMTGQLVQTVDKVSKTSDRIQLKNLPKGIYILKAGNQAAKFIIE